MREILQEEGVGVCRGPYGKQLSGGVFEFRLRHDVAEILQALGRRFRPEPGGERILAPGFLACTCDRVILLLGGYDKGRDPSRRRQQQEIELARRPLADFLRRRKKG